MLEPLALEDILYAPIYFFSEVPIANTVTMANKRSHSDFASSAHYTPNPKRNVFAKLSAPRKSTNYVYVSEDQEVSTAIFDTWSVMFEKLLENKDIMSNAPGDDDAWAKAVASGITQTTEATIMSHLATHASFKTKLTSLHALIDIATGIAFAPPSAVPDFVRRSPVPAYLMDNICRILKQMADVEIKWVVSEKTFVRKVRELRYTTGTCWNDQRWKTLDEVLRLVKHAGAINFRKCCKMVREHLGPAYKSPPRGIHTTKEESVIKIIRNEISSCINKESCFDAKYNALNALADIGITLIEEKHSGIIWGPLSAAMLRIGKVLMEEDRGRILETISSSFLNEFSGTNSEVFMLLRSLLKMHVFSDKHTFHSIAWEELYQSSQANEMIDLFEEGPDSSPGQKGSLILKILYLRWTRRHHRYDWDATPLDEVLDLFINTSEPLNCDRFSKKVDTCLPEYYLDGYSGEYATGTSNDVHQAVLRVSRRIDYRACFETKRNAFETLTKIGLRLTLYMKSLGDSNYHTSQFKSRPTETLLVSSMVRICQSLGNTELEKVYYLTHIQNY